MEESKRTDTAKGNPSKPGLSDGKKGCRRSTVRASRQVELGTLFSAYGVGVIPLGTFQNRAMGLSIRMAGGAAEIAHRLAQANRQNLEPWRVPFEAAVAQWDLAVSRASSMGGLELIAKAKEQFIVKARAKALAVGEAMFGSYVCILEDPVVARGILYHLLFEVPAAIRVARHNQYMLNQYPKLERSHIAQQVSKLAVPLFPPFGALRSINETILADKALLGGGRGEQKTVSPGAVGHYFRNPPAITGGDYYEPVVDAEGKRISAVQMVGTDHRLTYLYNEISSLRSELASALSRGSGSAGRGRVSRGGRGYGAAAPAASAPQRGAQPARRPGGSYRGGGQEDYDLPKNEAGPF